MKRVFRWDFAVIAILFAWMIVESSTLLAQEAKQLKDSILHLQTLEKYREAMQVYSLLLEKEPQLASHYYHRAELRKKMHDIRGAISDFSKAITLDSMQTEYYAARGEARWTLRDSKNAILDYSEAISLNRKNDTLYTYRGLIRIFSSEKELGCKDLKKAKRLGSEKAIDYLKEFCK